MNSKTILFLSSVYFFFFARNNLHIKTSSKQHVFSALLLSHNTCRFLLRRIGERNYSYIFTGKQNIGSGNDSMRYSRSSRLCMLVCKGQVTSKSVGLCFKWTDICSRAGGGHHPSNTMASKCVGVTRYPSDVSAIHPCTSLLSAKYKVSEQNF